MKNLNYTKIAVTLAIFGFKVAFVVVKAIAGFFAWWLTLFVLAHS